MLHLHKLYSNYQNMFVAAIKIKFVFALSPGWNNSEIVFHANSHNRKMSFLGNWFAQGNFGMKKNRNRNYLIALEVNLQVKCSTFLQWRNHLTNPIKEKTLNSNLKKRTLNRLSWLEFRRSSPPSSVPSSKEEGITKKFSRRSRRNSLLLIVISKVQHKMRGEKLFIKISNINISLCLFENKLSTTLASRPDPHLPISIPKAIHMCSIVFDVREMSCWLAIDYFWYIKKLT